MVSIVIIDISIIRNRNTPLSAACPTFVNITPPVGSQFQEGDALTCTSNDLPGITFTWTDMNGDVTDGSTATLAAGWFNWTCTATGNLTAPCFASDNIAGYANATESKYKQMILCLVY